MTSVSVDLGGQVATIYDVAKKAGVSPKTVSRVLNGDAPVNKHTRASVTQAINDLDYVPSQAARMMRSKKSGLIGLITGAISNAPEPNAPSGLPELHIVQSIQSEMATLGKILMIADTGGKREAVPVLARTFAQHNVEGLIYIADHHSKVDLGIATPGFPVVLVNCYDDAGTTCVLPDDRAGQAKLVAQLIQAGHVRIGLLSLDPAMAAARLRLEGYKDAHLEAGLTVDPDLVAPVQESAPEMSGEILMTALDCLVSLRSRPTVIACGNDVMAMRVYGLLRSRGLRVPEDISVAGFDDHRAISEMLHPQLTTVDLPYRSMGRKAARLIHEMIGEKRPASPVQSLVDGQVVWRSSVTALNNVKHLSHGRNET
jgi:LacI family transcriptional regulator